MSETTATAKFLRISPRKMRLSATLVVGKSVAQARHILQFTPKKGASFALTLLNSATANATHNDGLDERTLTVKSFTINQGPVLKRFRPRSRGRAEMARKPTSHATVVLEGVASKIDTEKTTKTSDK